MARIAGVNIPTQKRVEIALQYIHGIGPKFAKKTVTGLASRPNVGSASSPTRAADPRGDRPRLRRRGRPAARSR